MKIILLRHGHELPGSPAGRLSKRGLQRVDETAKRLVDFGVQSVQCAYHSETPRSRATHGEVACVIGMFDTTMTDKINPGRPMEILVAELTRLCDDGCSSVLVTGHEPQLTSTLLELGGISSAAAEDAIPAMALSQGDAAVFDWSPGQPVAIPTVWYAHRSPITEQFAKQLQ